MTTIEALKQILEEVEKADPEAFRGFLDPYKEKDETVISILTDETTKKCFTCASFYNREANQANLDAKYDQDNEELKVNARALSQKADVFQEMFWYFAKINHPELYDHDAIGIRKDWKLVKRNSTGTSLADLLKNLKGDD